MPEKISYKPFGELLKKVVDNRGRSCPTAETGIPLIATNCIKNENLYPVFEKVRYVSKEIFETWFRGHPEPDDIIFVNKGTPGRVCLVPNPLNFCIAQDMVSVRADEKKIYPKYLFAALRSSIIQGEIENLHVGSLIPHFKKSDFNDLKIPIPENSVQRFIGDLYFKLSQKIDLLNRQNKTLEQLAETLFRQWFVEEAEDSWKVGKLDDVISVKGGTTPSTTKPEYWNGNINWTSPRDLSNNKSIFLFDTERKISELGLKEIGSGLLPIGTVLLSSRAPIGYLTITEIPVAINQGYIAIICDKLVSNYFIFLWCRANMPDIENAGNGSVFQEISKATFRTLDFLIPPKEKLIMFDNEVDSIFQKIKSNTIQIKTVTNLRDTLLPKLMSGEATVKN
jgi:type I restriction enzyme S subunit